MTSVDCHKAFIVIHKPYSRACIPITPVSDSWALLISFHFVIGLFSSDWSVGAWVCAWGLTYGVYCDNIVNIVFLILGFSWGLLSICWIWSIPTASHFLIKVFSILIMKVYSVCVCVVVLLAIKGLKCISKYVQGNLTLSGIYTKWC